jgi:hypothetical protein
MSSFRFASLSLLAACAHTQVTDPTPRVSATTQPAAAAPAVPLSPAITSAQLGCSPHGGDGDHVPLSRHLGLTVRLELSEPGQVSIRSAHWSIELAGRPVEDELGPTPAALAHDAPLELSGEHYIAQDQGEDLEQGVESRAEREPVEVLLELSWTHGEVTTTSSYPLALRPTACFEVPQYDAEPLEQGELDTLDPAEIQRVIASVQPATKRCWERALQLEPTLHAIMSPSFTIASDGSVQDLDLHCDGCGDELIQCLTPVFEALSFPRPPHGGIVKISYPWHSDPSN